MFFNQNKILKIKFRSYLKHFTERKDFNAWLYDADTHFKYIYEGHLVPPSFQNKTKEHK